MGGFDLDAAEAVAGGGDVERFQVLDLLTLLVDKSLVVAESTSGRTRYRILETVRQYALEKLGESGQADAVRARHRDHYTAMAALLDTAARTSHEQRLEQAETEIDNLRSAFAWSRENSDTARARGWRRRCSRCGSHAAGSGKGWHGSTPPSPTKRHTGRGGAGGARGGARRQGHARRYGRHRQHGASPQALAIAREVDDPPCWPGHWSPAAASRSTTPRWPGHTSPRRSASPARWATGGDSANSDCRRTGRSWRVIRSRRARPPKKDASSPTPSVTGSPRVGAGGVSA